MNSTQYDALNFEDNTETTAVFGLNQIQIVQFSETSDFAWIISKPKKNNMVQLLTEFANDEMDENIELLYTVEYKFERENSQYGTASSSQTVQFDQTSQKDIDLARILANQISCQESNLTATFPTEFKITLKTNQDSVAMVLPTGDPAFNTRVSLTYMCDNTTALSEDMTDNYWKLSQSFPVSTDKETKAEVDYMENSIFYGEGYGYFLF